MKLLRESAQTRWRHKVYFAELRIKRLEWVLRADFKLRLALATRCLARTATRTNFLMNFQPRGYFKEFVRPINPH